MSESDGGAKRASDKPGHMRSEDRYIEALEKIDSRLAIEHQQNRNDLNDLKSKVDRILDGFPGQDPASHRRYHESIIEWRELRNRMVRECLIQAAKAGFLGAIGWIAYALWVAFTIEVTK